MYSAMYVLSKVNILVVGGNYVWTNSIETRVDPPVPALTHQYPNGQASTVAYLGYGRHGSCHGRLFEGGAKIACYKIKVYDLLFLQLPFCAPYDH